MAAVGKGDRDGVLLAGADVGDPERGGGHGEEDGEEDWRGEGKLHDGMVVVEG